MLLCNTLDVDDGLGHACEFWFAQFSSYKRNGMKLLDGVYICIHITIFLMCPFLLTQNEWKTRERKK